MTRETRAFKELKETKEILRRSDIFTEKLSKKNKKLLAAEEKRKKAFRQKFFKPMKVSVAQGSRGILDLL